LTKTKRSDFEPVNSTDHMIGTIVLIAPKSQGQNGWLDTSEPVL